MFILVFFVGCQDQPKVEQKADLPEDEKLPVVSKPKQMIWQKDGTQMVLIPASNAIKPFWMDTTEVTIGQFKKFLNSSGYKLKFSLLSLLNVHVMHPIIEHDDFGWNDIYHYSPTDNHPMVVVSWHDAAAYAKWVGKRLPTAKEWEFAARGGLIDKKYSWGDDVSLARDYANYNGTGGKDKWDKTTAPVGSFKPNGYGLYDMCGNVFEWCQDWYSVQLTTQKNYGVDVNKGKHMLGGSWSNGTSSLHLSYRAYGSKNFRGSYSGFRCVK